VRRLKPRGGVGLDTFLTKLTKTQMGTAMPGQARSGDIPKRRGAAITQYHLIALGQGKELAHEALNARHQVAHGRLPVRSPQQVCVRGEVRQRVWSNLGRTGTKPAIEGEKIAGNDDVSHALSLGVGPEKADPLRSHEFL